MPLTPHPVLTFWDRETFRVIRNAGCQTLARDAHEVTTDENEAYWLRRGMWLHAWLYSVNGGPYVGIGSLQVRDDRLWEFLAVVPECAGRGYGGEILEHLLAQTTEPVWCVIRQDNPGALRINERMGGWKTLHRCDGMVTQVHMQRARVAAKVG